MKKSIIILSFLVCFPGCFSSNSIKQAKKNNYDEKIDTYWKSGNTLPIEFSQQYPHRPLNIKNDTGINVLIDMAHQCDFFLLWWLRNQLHDRGLRTIGSHASLDSVLVPGSPCRVRIPVSEGLYPFAWWPACEFNVVITEGAPAYPDYLPQEQQALIKFVDSGGGLIISGNWVQDEQTGKEWGLNELLEKLGASIGTGSEIYNDKKVPLINVDDNWKVLIKGNQSNPVYARRKYGKGRIVLLASSSLFRYDLKDKEDIKAKSDFLAEIVKWSAAGKPAVAGSKKLPGPMGGGGGILPEKELRIGGMVVYYPKNQLSELLSTVRKDFPDITQQIYDWLPSPKPAEPMNMILASGNGGGWAVNAYLPKEVSTIAINPSHVRGIFAHEQAHTMSGPFKSAANHPFGGNQGDHHAGWFQGKILAKYDKTFGPNRGCDQVFSKDYDGTQKTPETIFKEANLKAWRADFPDYLMTWYVWQKLDDRYGPTWYPRWRWVQQQRWQEHSDKKMLTWEETVEDMSIAVGEDLFGFIISTGKKLERDKMGKIEFMGKELMLPPAPIEPTPPGNVNLDPIGDYTEPVSVRKSE